MKRGIIIISLYLLSSACDAKITNGLFKPTCGFNTSNFLFDQSCEGRWMVGLTHYSGEFPNGVLNIGYQKTTLESTRYDHSSNHILLNLGSDLLANSVFAYASYSAEISYNKQVQVAPKFSIGGKLLILDAEVSFIAHNDFHTFNPSITPEIGIYPGAVIQINYGHDIYLKKDTSENKYQNRISVRVTIPDEKRWRNTKRNV